MILNLSNYFDQGDKWLYTQLNNLKQNVFPDNFQLTVLYYKDKFYSDTSPGIALSRLQEYLALLDFPNFFIIIETSYESISKDLLKLKNLFCPYEDVIKFTKVDLKFEKINIKNESFCIYPWIHMYVNPQGKVGPCCNFNENYPIGDLVEESLDQIVNNSKMMNLRRQLLDGQRPQSCSGCWIKEDNGIRSARQKANTEWKKYLQLKYETDDLGYFPNFKLRYLDIRLSNVCNLKCRMCGGNFSSRIAQEESILYNNKKTIELKLNKKQIKKTLKFIETNILDLEHVYFAGGEPLIMPEHYQILDLLIKYQRTDIYITYNTNFTILKYKTLDIIEYWKKFSNIHVGASIDLIGNQAEYVRNGSSYDIIEKNYDILKDYINFSISSIVHLMNIFNLPKLQKHWIEFKNLPADALSMSVLTSPDVMSLQVLPKSYKELANQYIKDHIDWCQTIGAEALIKNWQNVLEYMNLEDKSFLLKEFFRLNDDKDKYRNEKFEGVFPEYQSLRSYI